MANKKMDGISIWKQFEDLLIPGLRLSVIERAVYSHLLRHSRLEGKQRLQFSIHWLARGAGLGDSSARKGVRRLAAKGALRLAERSKRGHVIEVRLPEEVRGVRARKIAEGKAERLRGAASLEETDFLEKRSLREAIHAREGGHCFYCLRRVTTATRCIDHIIPQVRMGRNGYRNLVSSCAECNSQKGERRAQDFLRWLYREGRLESSEFKERLRALEKLASGKLRPAVNGKEGAR
jgi:5-methylcytosine-specific restriction endonuclease McrA